MSENKILGVKKAFWIELRVLITLILIALLVKATIVEIYVVPTGSMEDTILPGDMLIGNKFIYGLRTPKKISLIWTRLGFDVPFVRLPKFKEVQSGDVVIFEFPRDPFQKYVKRCIGTAGQEVEIDHGTILVDGKEMPLPEDGKFTKGSIFSADKEQKIFPYFTGNQDNIDPFTVPYRGMKIDFHQVQDWISTITLLVQDGNSVQIGDKKLSIIDPAELARMVGFLRYKFLELINPGSKNSIRYDQISEQREFMLEMLEENHSNDIYNPWELDFSGANYNLVFKNLTVNGKHLEEIGTYTLKHDFYFFMGDNRDNSSDSRFWGFVPDHQILGTPLFSLVNLMKFRFRFRFIS